MADQDPQQKIEGLPAGATVTPLQSQQVEGLPAGATVTPLGAQDGQQTATPQEPSFFDKAKQGIGNLLHVQGQMIKGAAKGALNTASNIDSQVAKIPVVGDLMNRSLLHPLTPQPNLAADEQRMAVPHNTDQAIGKAAEQTGEFLLPGLGEESAEAHAAELLPKAPKLAKALTKIGYNGLTTGAVNKAQGGSFTTGALMGAGGAGVGLGLSAMAPRVAESALGMPIKSKLFGKTPGEAILNETTGVRPGTIADQARAAQSSLGQQLTDLTDQASAKQVIPPPTPQIKGLLPAPLRTIPLGNAPTAGEMPGALIDAEKFPAQNVGEARITRSPGGQFIPKADQNVEFPDESGLLPSARGNGGRFLTRQPTRSAFMAGPTQEGLQAGEGFSGPGVSGPGVIQTRAPIPTTDTTPYHIPSTLSPDAPSTRPALTVLDDAIAKAKNQNAADTTQALQKVRNQLTVDSSTGEAIPEQLTSSKVLALKRGITAENKLWDQGKQNAVKPIIQKVYHALDSEVDRTVPGTKEINQRLSSLFPVVERADVKDLGENALQRAFGRLGRPAGALLGAAAGGFHGYQQGGIPGMIKDGLIGGIAPDLIASPTSQMLIARGLNSPATAKLLSAAPLVLNRAYQQGTGEDEDPDQTK
jgi:hypothetical protein